MHDILVSNAGFRYKEVDESRLGEEEDGEKKRVRKRDGETRGSDIFTAGGRIYDGLRFSVPFTRVIMFGLN